MALGSYDSPTFLGQKDKYLMGLSLPELLLAMGVAFGWFLVTLFFPISILMRMVVVLPLTGVSVAFLFVRISGLSIPVFVLLAISRVFKKPSFEETRELMLGGQSDWLKSQELKSQKGSKFGSLLGRKRKLLEDNEARQAELRAEMDKQLVEGASAVEGWVREGVRTLVKGH